MNIYTAIANFSVIIPILLFLFRVKEIATYYIYLEIILISGLIVECCNYFDSFNSYSIELKYFYILIETQLYLILFTKWKSIKRSNKILLQSIFFILWAIDFIYFRKYNIMWMYLVQLGILIIISLDILNKTNNNALDSKIHKLILIPFLVFAIYFTVLHVLMSQLYNKATMKLFINLYSVITVINFLSYISYSLALLWAPKKERYL